MVARNFSGDSPALFFTASMADILDHGNFCSCFHPHLRTKNRFFQSQAEWIVSDRPRLCGTTALAVRTGNNHAVGSFNRIYRGMNISGPKLSIHIPTAMSIKIVNRYRTGKCILNRDCHGSGLRQALAVAIDRQWCSTAVFSIHDDRKCRRTGNTLRSPDILFPIVQPGRNTIHGKF